MMQENIDTNQKCCFNCEWYEERSGFCRKNPPTPIPSYIKGVGNITNSAFPKINMPALDWCSFFMQDNQSKMLND